MSCGGGSRFRWWRVAMIGVVDGPKIAEAS
jgi:hypothetical protein